MRFERKMRSLDSVVLPRRAADMLEEPPPGHRWPDRSDRWWDVSGVLLTEEEYLRARAQLRRAEGCGMSVAALSEIGGDDVRMQVLGCGQRRCESCGDKAREYARRRLATSDIYHPGIEWRLFVTLTMPRNAFSSKEDAWKAMGRVMSEWCRRQQKWLGAGGSPYKSRLHIGWALEAHKDGWPHAHVVMSIPYPTWGDQARRMNRKFRADWNAVLKVKYSIVQTEKPKSPRRAGDYLSKYIAKMRDWGEGLLALLYRKRMWSSTLPRIPTMVRPPPRWQVTKIMELSRAIGELYRLRRRGFEVVQDPQGWKARITQAVRDADDFWSSPAGILLRSEAVQAAEGGEAWLRRMATRNPFEWRPASTIRGGPAPPGP